MNEMRYWTDRVKELKDSFQKVIDDPGASGNEKTLARMAMKIGRRINPASRDERAEHQGLAMEGIKNAMSTAVQGPIAVVIATACSSTSTAIDGSSIKFDVLRTGLEEIAHRADTTEEQKEFAQAALEEGSALARTSAEAAVVQMEKATDKIISDFQSGECRMAELKRITENLNKEPSGGIVQYDDCLVVDGLRLEMEKK
jgi:hypothetical protein